MRASKAGQQEDVDITFYSNNVRHEHSRGVYGNKYDGGSL